MAIRYFKQRYGMAAGKVFEAEETSAQAKQYRDFGFEDLGMTAPGQTALATATQVKPPPVTVPPTPVAPSPVDFEKYTVKAGDTLSRISKRSGTTLEKLLELNPGFRTGGRNPNLIYSGEKLTLPIPKKTTATEAISATPTATIPTGTPPPPQGFAYRPNVTGELVLVPEGTSGAIAYTPEEGELPELPEEEVNAADILERLGLTLPSGEEITESVVGSQKYRLLQEGKTLAESILGGAAEAEKAEKERQFAGNVETLKNRLASRGLFFSGIKTKQIEALATNLAQSKLDIDRELAGKLLVRDQKFTEDVFKLIEDTVKEAQEGKKEALGQLNQAGLALVGDKLVPTITARREVRQERLEELRVRQADLQEAKFDYYQAKSEEQLRQGQQRIDISEAHLKIAEARLELAERRGTGRRDRELSISEILALTDRGVTVTPGMKLSDLENIVIPEKEEKAPTEAERRQLAGTVARKFVDKIFGWGVPSEYQGDFGGDKKVSDKQLRAFLIARYGITNKEAEDIVAGLE